ncbi:MAG: NAD(P)/FAD-dependent oxidoreductase [Campylobacterota bacterium]|nr:NAD(P)/FAD-dependent oxidoreductase [Campylobacterota bacterium]
MNKNYDLIVIGAGPSGIIASIEAKRRGKKVLLVEKLSQIGVKLKATGGGRCNLTNTLKKDEFMKSFGKSGRFMTQALNKLDYNNLISFFKDIGVEIHIPDGFRVFPKTHSASTIVDALTNELNRLDIDIIYNNQNIKIKTNQNSIKTIILDEIEYISKNILISTGGLGYPKLGASGDGHKLAKELGHTITSLYPAMMPLYTKESWVSYCRADTIAKASITINIAKYKKIKAQGDLIFTNNGIRGPIVLDFAREITPFLDKYEEVPIFINMIKGKNQDDILNHIKKYNNSNQNRTIKDSLKDILPISVLEQIAILSKVDINSSFKKIDGKAKNIFLQNLTNTPLTIVGHDGFKMAMITRGGVSLKEIDPNTMQSKIIDGLYFAGELVDLDGPCGGYNLQWAFSSGYLCGNSI